MKVKSYMLSVVLFLSIVSLVGCNGGRDNPAGPSSNSIVGSWYGCAGGWCFTYTYTADGMYKEYVYGVKCPEYVGTYTVSGDVITVTNVKNDCVGKLTRPKTETYKYKIEDDKLWLWYGSSNSPIEFRRA